MRAELADGSVITRRYDPAGRVVQLEHTADPNGPTILTYDLLDRLQAETTSLGTVNYSYDALGRRTRMTVSGQALIAYTYDANSRLQSIQQEPLNPIGLEYDLAGRRTRLTLPNGVSTEYQYDAGSRLTALIYRNASGLLGDLTYQYDAAGNKVAVAGSFAHTLLPAPVVSGTYDPANRQLAFGPKSMTYDANGNLATVTDGSTTTSYAWDARNRLLGISAPGRSALFAYDTGGRRSQKTIDGQVTGFRYDGADIVREITAGTVADYVNGPRIDEPLLRTQTGGASYYAADPLGNVLALTTGSGNIATEYTYTPFGEALASGGATDNPLQYTGRENDGLGLYYLRNRYYDPKLGRFISEDPVGLAAGDLNVYAYARGNPLAFRDPFGLCVDPGGPGLRYCIDAYIEDKSVRVIGAGDDRGPDPFGGTYRSRQLVRPDGSPQVENKPGVTTLRYPATSIAREGTLGVCGAIVRASPLGGRKIVVYCSATNGFAIRIGDLVFDNALSYNFTIWEKPDGTAEVVKAYGTPYPSFEIYQYGRNSGAIPIYNYSQRAAGTSVGDLGRGAGPLPLR